MTTILHLLAVVAVSLGVLVYVVMALSEPILRASEPTTEVDLPAVPTADADRSAPLRLGDSPDASAA